MRFKILACDYDGTIASLGAVSGATIESLEKVRNSGRKLILVTGRELDELLQVFSRADLFERVVAENGALIFRPHAQDEKVLAVTPPEEFVRELHRRGVFPISTGRVIVATKKPHETTVLKTIRDLGLELQVIFNKDAVMVLPSGVNKATGLQAVLDDLGMLPTEVVGIGDAENDHAFLELCGCSVAVANAVPRIKDRVDMITHGSNGVGVRELIEKLISTDLADVEFQRRQDVPFGSRIKG